MKNNKNTTKTITDSLTFDDVLVVPRYSEVLPRDVSVRTKLTKNITLNIPIISAAMDTVTESRLAIALAQTGGLGVIHKNMPIERQVSEVARVKRSENAIIEDPFKLSPTASLKDAKNLMQEKGIGGTPIVEDNGMLVGILTSRDIRSEMDLSKSVSAVMTKSVITAKENCSLVQAKSILEQHKIKKLPLVDSKGILKGLITYKDILKSESFPNACRDKMGRLCVGAAVGVSADLMDRVKLLIEAGADVLVLDSAHGDSKGILDATKNIKKKYPKIDLIVGNVATGEGALNVARAGADAVKVGVGPGSICTTRIIAGIGVPQLSAVMNASEALKKAKLNIPVIADGGIRYSGDMVKALVGGASLIMAGSLFAGTDEAPGEVVLLDGRKFKSYRGMGSIEAMQEGSKDRYFQDKEKEANKLVPEGIVGIVPYKGPLADIVYQYVGGLRAGMGYVGAKNIQDLWSASFTKITPSGMKESHPHDITITKEAPNYTK